MLSISGRLTRAPIGGSIAASLTDLVELQHQGLIRHIGLSNVTPTQMARARPADGRSCACRIIYNIAQRHDDCLIDALARRASLTYLISAGWLHSVAIAALSEIAGVLGATPMQVALAWLLHRSPNVLLIPGTSSVPISARISKLPH